MFQFYYSSRLIDKFVDRCHSELLQMDTDSLYMAVSSAELEDRIRPERRQQFFNERHHWFPKVACA